MQSSTQLSKKFIKVVNDGEIVWYLGLFENFKENRDQTGGKKQKNKEWLLSLNYNPFIENNGYILSLGFEYFINIYCTDLSIEEAYKGKLEGHYTPVINCQFLSNSYMAVSVDEECCVRIWDTKLKICLQVIPTPKKNFKVVNLLCLAKFSKFLVFGNKIIYYDAKYKEEDNIEKNQIKDDNYPIKIEYNKYY